MSYIKKMLTASGRPVGKSTLGKLSIALIIFLSVFFIFAHVADEVVEGETQFADEKILLLINASSNKLFDQIMIAITTLGNVAAIVSITAVTLYILWRHKQWRAIAQVVYGIGGSVLLNIMLKLIFERDRPELWTRLIQEHTYSFPSGHALLTASLAMTFILLTWHTKWRWYVVAGGVSYTLLVGFSRLYLGVHYPTDVLAGWCVGVGWVVVVAAILGVLKGPLWYTKSNGNV